LFRPAFDPFPDSHLDPTPLLWNTFPATPAPGPCTDLQVTDPGKNPHLAWKGLEQFPGLTLLDRASGNTIWERVILGQPPPSWTLPALLQQTQRPHPDHVGDQVDRRPGGGREILSEGRNGKISRRRYLAEVKGLSVIMCE
jgi:hypothetical protein